MTVWSNNLLLILYLGLTAQYRLEKAGHVKTAKVVGGGGSIAAGTMIGALGGPGGAVVGGLLGFAAWFLVDTIVHAKSAENRNRTSAIQHSHIEYTETNTIVHAQTGNTGTQTTITIYNAHVQVRCVQAIQL